MNLSYPSNSIARKTGQSDAPNGHPRHAGMLARFARGIRRATASHSVVADARRIISLDDTYAITDAVPMQSVTATTARSMIYKLLDDASESHQPIQITGKRSSAVLVAEDDWRAIQESLYLLSIPGMRESIRAGVATPVSACSKKLAW